MGSRYEPDAEAAAAAERQTVADDFALKTFGAGAQALAVLYPVALARMKRAKTNRETVAVSVAQLAALCHAHGLAVSLLGKVEDGALVDAMARLAEPPEPSGG